MTVWITGDTLITVRNNGKPPKGPILESGGLLSLRRIVEEAGGEMTVTSEPEFLLRSHFPNMVRTGDWIIRI